MDVLNLSGKLRNRTKEYKIENYHHETDGKKTYYISQYCHTVCLLMFCQMQTKFEKILIGPIFLNIFQSTVLKSGSVITKKKSRKQETISYGKTMTYFCIIHLNYSLKLQIFFCMSRHFLPLQVEQTKKQREVSITTLFYCYS